MKPTDQIDRTNPWKTAGTRVVYDNPWITVREDQVTQPDGQSGIYGVVHFKNIAVGVLPMEADGSIHLVGQFRYPLDQYSWEIPEGGCPDNEDPLAAAKRELLEETGISAGRWQEIGRAHLSNSVCDEEAIIYLATDLTKGPALPDGTEKLESRRLPFAQALEMTIRGEITDSLSVIAIMKYAIMLQNQWTKPEGLTVS
jgi:8-oxo-dGTP pyrophosphatase MutT (NUDIX family)